MVTAQIDVVFEGPGMGDGVSVRDLNETLKRVQDAVRLMAAHLAGTGKRGRPPEWLRRQSSLRLQSVFPGSFGAALYLSPTAPPGGENYGAKALDAILGWDGPAAPSLPEPVTECLNGIVLNLSPEVYQVRLGDPAGVRQVVISRAQRQRQAPHRRGGETEILLHGRLLEIDWKNSAAELHNYGETPVALRFDASLNETMRQLATRYVRVEGIGRFNANDEWETIMVHKIAAERSIVDDFHEREPEIFDPDQATSFYQDDDDDPVSIAEFIRVIYEARDA